MAQTSARKTGQQTGEKQEARHLHEDSITKNIEQQTAKIPSDVYLLAAIGSMAGSAYLQYRGDRELSLFVGQWAPAFLTIGVYNKMVKLLGSE